MPSPSYWIEIELWGWSNSTKMLNVKFNVWYDVTCEFSFKILGFHQIWDHNLWIREENCGLLIDILGENKRDMHLVWGFRYKAALFYDSTSII